MQTSVDQTGRVVNVDDSPHRIISLVPSQSELLYDLGLTTEVIGITKFCIHPQEWFRTKQHVGGTKKLNLELIRSLNPDLIIANKEENEQLQIEELAKEFPVWISDISTYSDAKRMVLALGTITNRYFEAIRVLDKIDQAFDALPVNEEQRKILSVAYLIWDKPMMAAGGNTFINGMLESCGLTNVFSHLPRYPEISSEQLMSAKPDLLFLSSEPFPFSEKHLKDFSNRYPGIKALCVDGELFSWYGSRLQYLPAYICKLFEQIESVK
ncbi:MAG: helical backbone metal receptor [Bacteroidetes bacterium]|nr:helical backbone metal receptor [Bacteroidota bacterium]